MRPQEQEQHPVRQALEPYIEHDRVEALSRYFQTGPGQYAENDVFIGVSVPNRREVAKALAFELSEDLLASAMHHPVHEVRHVAVFIVLRRFSAERQNRPHWHQFLFDHFEGVNNWDLVDSCAHKIFGRWAYEHGDQRTMEELLNHHNMWYKRGALVATLFHLSKGNVQPTLDYCPIAAPDASEILQKAIGWVLKVAYEVNPTQVLPHLELYAMEGLYTKLVLRIALEKASATFRRSFIEEFYRPS